MFSSLYWARLGKHAGHRQGAPALVTPPTPTASWLTRSTHWLRKVKRYRKTTSTGLGSLDSRWLTSSTRSPTTSSSAEASSSLNMSKGNSGGSRLRKYSFSTPATESRSWVVQPSTRGSSPLSKASRISNIRAWAPDTRKMPSCCRPLRLMKRIQLFTTRGTGWPVLWINFSRSPPKSLWVHWDPG